MAIKAVLHPRPKADGTLSITIRVTKGSRSSYVFLGYSVLREQWDPTLQRVKRTYPNSVRLNNLITQKLAEVSGTSIELDTLGVAASPRIITSRVKPRKDATFFAQADAYLRDFQETGKFNQYSADKPRVNRFREFIGKDDIAFADITHGVLSRYRVWLQPRIRTTRENCERTIVNHLSVIRNVFARAIREGLFEAKNSPFGKDGLRLKFPETSKIGLSREEIAALEEVEIPHPASCLARKTWLLGYYFAGMRISDLLRLKWSDLYDGRLQYTMQKSGKHVSIKVPAQAQVILDGLDTTHELVLPYLRNVKASNRGEMQRQTGLSTRLINSYLQEQVKVRAGITKELTTHITRHTFAQLAGDSIPNRVLQILYRHSDAKTTEQYQERFKVSEADAALDKVLNE